MWRKLVKNLTRRRVSKNSRRPQTVRPFLEILEHRFVLGVISTWTGGAGANDPNWSTPQNWSAGVPLAPGDEATFNETSVAKCTVDVDVDIDELNIASGYTGTITLNDIFQVGNTGEVGLMSIMDGGTITGSPDFNFNIVNCTFDWSGGTFDKILEDVHADAVMTIGGDHSKYLNNGATLSADGEVDWTGGTGGFYLDNHSEIVMTSSGVFKAKAPGTIDTHDTNTLSYLGIYQNAGLNIDVGTGNTFTLNVFLQTSSNNFNGNVNIVSGTLATHAGSDLAGIMNISSGATLKLASGDPKSDALDGVSIINALGQPGAACNFYGHVTVTTGSSISCDISDLSTTLDGSGNLTTSGSYGWYGMGPWSGSGKMIVNGTLTFVGSQFGFSLGRTIDNYNTVVWRNSTVADITVTNGANIINEGAAGLRAGATFDIQVDADIVNNGGGTFQNFAGAVTQKSAGNGTTNIRLPVLTPNAGTFKELTAGRIKYWNVFNTIGTIIVSGAGGGMDFLAGFEQDGGSTSIQAGHSSMTVAGGNLTLTGGTMTLSSSQTSLSVTGQIQQSGGTMRVAVSDTITVSDLYNESGGTVELGYGGTMTATNGMMIGSGAVLEGTGQIRVTNAPLTNGGTINPGWQNGSAALGSISVTGDYTQTSSGYVNVGIFSSGGSANYDVLDISGAATLNGTLNVSLYGSPPTAGSFEVITWGSRNGTFTNVILPTTGHWDKSYDDTNPPYGFMAIKFYQ